MDRKPRSRPPRDSPDRREGLGRAIQSLRAERGLKRQELAERAGLSYAYLAEIENGKKEPSTKVLAALAAALGIRLPELMEVAESLQEMAEVTEGPTPQIDADELRRVSPRMARPLSGAAWFHDRIAPPAAVSPMSAHSVTPTRLSPSEVSPRTELLKELQQLASRMPPEDLERVLDLARRLTRQ